MIFFFKLINGKDCNSSKAVILRAWSLDQHHWEPVRNANSPPPSQTNWVRISGGGAQQSRVFATPLGNSNAHWSLKTTALINDLNSTDKWNISTNQYAHSDLLLTAEGEWSIYRHNTQERGILVEKAERPCRWHGHMKGHTKGARGGMLVNKVDG